MAKLLTYEQKDTWAEEASDDCIHSCHEAGDPDSG